MNPPKLAIPLLQGLTRAHLVILFRFLVQILNQNVRGFPKQLEKKWSHKLISTTWDLNGWPQLLLFWKWVVSIIKTGVLVILVRVITNGGSWVVIHIRKHHTGCRVVNITRYFLRKWTITEKLQSFCNLLFCVFLS